jgi:alkaline phosphatase
MKTSPPSLSRRRFLQSAGLTGALGSTLGLPLRAAPAPASPARARNLIFMVADGMSPGTLSAANHWLNLREDRDTAWMRLYRDGLARRALLETCSAGSLVPDSAAAGSSWGSGHRIPNRHLNVDAEGRELSPLYTFGRSAGKRLGLVSTARITHATPASFAASVPHRDEEDTIALQYLEREVDVLLGGGRRHFTPAQRKDGMDLVARYRRAGYAVVETAADLRKAPRRGRLLGIFSDRHLPYALDRAHDPALGAATPTLEAMMEAALERLRDAPEGFLLQVESGRVDHAAHENDTATTLADMLEFDRAVALARRFAETQPDTLVIVTTDHGTGGLVVNGEGLEYVGTAEGILRLGQVSASFEALGRRHRVAPLSPAEISHALGLAGNEALEARLADFLPSWNGAPKPLGHHLRETLAPLFACSWTTLNHTGELAEFAAFGPGSERFDGFYENWEIHHLLREALSI